MIVVLSLIASAFAGDCDEPVDSYFDGVAQGDEASYLCVIATDTAVEPLVQRIHLGDESGNRYTRALALHLAFRAEMPWEPALIRLLTPSDRRLLADAVKAKRGRRSPSAAHDEIFKKQPWYKVEEHYTDNLLTEVERANIEMANNPPPPDVLAHEKPGDAPMADPATSVAPEVSLCGCASNSGASWVVLPLLFVGLRRRVVG